MRARITRNIVWHAAKMAAPVPVNTDALGRSLVRLLRHGAAREGLAVSPDGFAPLSNVLVIPSVAKHHPTLSAVMHVVRTCPKQRLGIREEAGVVYIRANQGHTLRCLEDDKLLTRIVDAEVRVL